MTGPPGVILLLVCNRSKGVSESSTSACPCTGTGTGSWWRISAYPAQAREGIETVVLSLDQIAVLFHVLKRITASRHVRPIIYLDQELRFVPEADAPGVTAYRDRLCGLLKGHTANPMPHDEIIAMLDAAAQMFRVLLIKTTTAIPYTSVFIQLDCRYWSADAESRLRASMIGR